MNKYVVRIMEFKGELSAYLKFIGSILSCRNFFLFNSFMLDRHFFSQVHHFSISDLVCILKLSLMASEYWLVALVDQKCFFALPVNIGEVLPSGNKCMSRSNSFFFPLSLHLFFFSSFCICFSIFLSFLVSFSILCIIHPL